MLACFSWPLCVKKRKEKEDRFREGEERKRKLPVLFKEKERAAREKGRQERKGGTG